MTFDRTAYIKTLYGTPGLDESMLQVLILMANYCTPELRVRVREFTRQIIAQRLHWGVDRTRAGMNRLQQSGLLRVIRHRRNQWWQMPTEDELAQYNPKHPKVNAWKTKKEQPPK